MPQLWNAGRKSWSSFPPSSVAFLGATGLLLTPSLPADRVRVSSVPDGVDGTPDLVIFIGQGWCRVHRPQGKIPRDSVRPRAALGNFSQRRGRECLITGITFPSSKQKQASMGHRESASKDQSGNDPIV